MGSLVVALDWDLTLVDEEQEWLPGALDMLRWLRREKHKVFIHSARANDEFGRHMIERKLEQFNFKFPVKAKPMADIYVDDKGFCPESSFDVIREVRRLKRAASQRS